MDEKMRTCHGKKFQRFSLTENDCDVPFFEYCNPQPDPILKHDKPKKTPKIPKMRMKCITCRDKKENVIAKETKKIERYVVPKTQREQRVIDERHRREEEMFFVCKKEVIRLPSPLSVATTGGMKVEFTSAYKHGSGKVVPEKISMTDSTMKWPPAPTLNELMAKAPKSRIYINKTKKVKMPVSISAVDSVDFIYKEPYRRIHPGYTMPRGQDDSILHLRDIEQTAAKEEPEAEETEAEEEESEKGGKDLPEEPVIIDYYEEYAGEMEAEAEIEIEANEDVSDDRVSVKRERGRDLSDVRAEPGAWWKSNLIKEQSGLDQTSSILKSTGKLALLFDMTMGSEDEMEYTSVRHISKASIATSIDSEYKLKYTSRADLDTSIEPNVISKILQKYQRDSEMELAVQTRVPFKRGTLKSHSVSKLPKEPKSFYFGIKTGTIHFGDSSFSERSRYKQGLPMTVCAYAFSFMKHPSRWSSRDIDNVLNAGDKLYWSSLNKRHVHDQFRMLQPEELCDEVRFGEKNIKYKIEEPEIAGYIKSKDPKVFNLLKGLSLFFQKNRSGILQSYDTNILIWKQKHFFVFDPEPRSQELYTNENGTTVLAHFYDIPSILVMLMDRGNLENWPFIVSKISIKKICSIQAPADTDSVCSDYREDHLYKIINQEKAVLSGSISIEDECFGETKNCLGCPASVVALVYSHITPASAWHKRTIDKILYVANQFYREWMKLHPEETMLIENIPSFFTVGPLTFEIAIYANQYAGLMYQKQVCLFEELITKFFSTNTAAIVQIDKYVLAVWKSRNMYYTFDPYFCDSDGFKCLTGSAVLNMNTNIPALVRTVVRNFSAKDYIFKIHILKVVKIHRDPEFERPRRKFNSEASLIESLRITNKTVTIDDTECAMRTTDLDEPLAPSLSEIGSFVGSLDFKYVSPVPRSISRTITKFTAPQPEKIYDLDSPSLSDTQVDKRRPGPLKESSFEFRLLEEITREERELEKLVQLGEGPEDFVFEGDLDRLDIPDIETIMEMKDASVQQGRDYEIGYTTTQVNTDLLGLTPLLRIVLEPNKIPPPAQTHRPYQQSMMHTEEIRITQSSELAKSSNFTALPDGSEILYGTKNITQLDDDFESSTPFVSIVAVIMAKKYTLNTWSKEVIDAILDYGAALQKNVGVTFPKVPKIRIPKIVIGTNAYTVTVDYMFDSLLEPSILETCLAKLVFANRESAIIVTQSYSCAVFCKRCLYYMYDGFGCNLVGLGAGPGNEGLACTFRFKTLHHLVSRFFYNKKQRELVEPTEASRFVISTVDVNTIWPESKEKIGATRKLPPVPRMDCSFESNPENVNKERQNKDKSGPKPKNVVGYHAKGKYIVIEASENLGNRAEASGLIKPCHFASICAMIGLFGQPIKSWDTKRMDYVLKMGQTLFGFIDNQNFADKRNIRNLLFDKYFFDIFVKKINIQNSVNRRNLTVALDYLLQKNKYLLVQFPNCCFVVYNNSGKDLHLFDPYGFEQEDARASWIKLNDTKSLVKYFKKQKLKDNFFFYTVHVSRIERASKKQQIEYRLRVTNVKETKPVKKLKILHEDEDWLLVYPIPWSRMKKNLASGCPRGTKANRWFNWDVEYAEDLYSLAGNLHQTCAEFPSKSRGKQTIANCITAIVMTEIYDFTEWNPEVLDSILRAGDKYFTESLQSKKDKDYEVKVEDFKANLLVFPYSVTLDIYPLIEGTMFLQKPQQFNLSKALRYFFEEYENRCGIICCGRDHCKTQYIAFGRVRNGEYFMYDCQAIGPPMFLDKFGSKSYILRTLSLNRLLHCLTLTLRGGDFFIYYVGLTDDQSEEKQIRVVHYDNDNRPPRPEQAPNTGQVVNAEDKDESEANADRGLSEKAAEQTSNVESPQSRVDAEEVRETVETHETSEFQETVHHSETEESNVQQEVEE